MTLLSKNMYWIVGLLTVVAVSMPLFARAALEVQFEATPLFSEVNIAPGESVARSVVVTNTGTSTESVYISVSGPSSGGLADVMSITITSLLDTYFTGTFSNFFATTPLNVGTLNASSSRTYVLTAAFPEDAGNTYQANGMQFDLVVGFWDGTSVTDSDSNGGGGGGSGGGNTTPDDEDDVVVLPEGRVAGEATSTPFGTFTDVVRQAAASFQSLVAGATAEGTAEAATGDTEEEVPEGVVAGTETDGVAISWGESLCTFWWLFLLAVILLAWSWFDDVRQKSVPTHQRFFFANAIFTGVYLAALLGFHIFGVLEQLWWVFVLAWTAMVVADYRAHRAYPSWDSTYRNWAYAGAGWFFITTSFFFGFPCVWWPFFALLVVSGLVYILEHND